MYPSNHMAGLLFKKRMEEMKKKNCLQNGFSHLNMAALNTR